MRKKWRNRDVTLLCFLGKPFVYQNRQTFVHMILVACSLVRALQESYHIHTRKLEIFWTCFCSAFSPTVNMISTLLKSKLLPLCRNVSAFSLLKILNQADCFCPKSLFPRVMSLLLFSSRFSTPLARHTLFTSIKGTLAERCLCVSIYSRYSMNGYSACTKTGLMLSMTRLLFLFKTRCRKTNTSAVTTCFSSSAGSYLQLNKKAP
jgi:hypothetical protein